MNEQRRAAVERLSDLLRRETALLDRQDYGGAGLLLSDKQAALAALEASPDHPCPPDTDADTAAVRLLADLAEANRIALQRALHVQDRIMGIMADAARRMMETPLYGGRGTPAMRRTSLAVAVAVRA